MCEQGWRCVHIRQRSEGWACKKRGGDRQKCSVAGAASHVVVPHRRRVSPLATGTGTRPTTETVAAKPSQRVAQLGVAKARRTMAVLRGCCRLLEANGQAIRAGYTGRLYGQATRTASRQADESRWPECDGQSCWISIIVCVVAAVGTSRRCRHDDDQYTVYSNVYSTWQCCSTVVVSLSMNNYAKII